MSKAWTIPLVLVAWGLTARAQGDGEYAGRTQCLVDGRWITVVGDCPSSGGDSGEETRARSREAREYSRYVRAYNRALGLHKRAVGADAASAVSLGQQALASVDEALWHQPGDHDAQTLRRRIRATIACSQGQLAVMNGDHDRGIALFREAQDLYPESNALWERNIQWANEQRVNRRQQTTAESEALNRKALALVDEEKYAEAEAAYREAVRLDPSSFAAHLGMGIVQVRQLRFREGEASAREAVRLDPGSDHAFNILGVALEFQGRTREAEAAYREAVRLRPDNSRAHANLGDVLKQQARHAEAEAAYRKALELEPGNAELRAALDSVIAAQRPAAQRQSPPAPPAAPAAAGGGAPGAVAPSSSAGGGAIGEAQANADSTRTGLASRTPEGRTTGRGEDASGTGRRVFDDAAPGGAPPVTAGSPGPGAAVKALTSHVPAAAMGDPAIQASVAWYGSLERQKEETRALLANAQKSVDAADVIEKARRDQLAYQLKQLEDDQQRAQRAIQERLVSLGLPWIERPAGE